MRNVLVGLFAFIMIIVGIIMPMAYLAHYFWLLIFGFFITPPLCVIYLMIDNTILRKENKT